MCKDGSNNSHFIKMYSVALQQVWILLYFLNRSTNETL